MDWIAPHPYRGEFTLTAIIIQVAIGNGSPNPNSVSTFELNIGGTSLFPAEHQTGQSAQSILVSGGRASVAPHYDNWLNLPVELTPFGSATGWLGFIPTGLTLAEARRQEGVLTAVMASGGDKRARVPPCSLETAENA